MRNTVPCGSTLAGTESCAIRGRAAKALINKATRTCIEKFDMDVSWDSRHSDERWAEIVARAVRKSLTLKGRRSCRTRKNLVFGACRISHRIGLRTNSPPQLFE